MQPKADLTQPLRNPVFRNVWISGLISNVGTMIQGVAAAWTMAELTRSASLVALVQTAAMLPTMLLAVFAGTLADIYDRRMVAISALIFAFVGAIGLALTTALGFVTPALLLVICFLVACGTSVYSPAWQAMSRDQVAPKDLPAAIALNSMSYNVGRSVGPAVGGLIVAAAGAATAFTVNALSFVPIVMVLASWQHRRQARLQPRDRLLRAIRLGVTYVWHAPSIRVVLIRALATTLCSSALLALLPLIVQRRLGGNASVYGMLLASFGIGAVLGTTVIALLQGKVRRETIVRSAATVAAAGLITVAFSKGLILSALVLFPVGMAWTTLNGAFNVSIQSPAPGWMTARAVSMFQASVGAGIALGSLLWGSVATLLDTPSALALAGLCLFLAQAIGLVAPIPEVAVLAEPDADRDPIAGLPAVAGHLGPVTILVEYRLPPERIEAFLGKVAELRRIRLRHGASRWRIGRDISEGVIWLERFSFPTWHDYLQYLRRMTDTERGHIFDEFCLIDGVAQPKLRYLIDAPNPVGPPNPM